MQIIQLQAENIKKLKVVSIKPDGSLVQITGKNANGKTSVLDSIALALKVTMLDQMKPVRDGEERGLIKLTLGTKGVVELVITRKFKVDPDGDYTTSLHVESPDGAKFPSPQTMLDELFSSLTFDPLAFSRMDEKEQIKAVRTLLPGIDFAAVEAANKADFEKRTEINRAIKQAEAAANNGPDGVAPALVDETALIQEMADCSEFNAGIEKRKAAREKAAETIAGWKKEMADDEAEIKRRQDNISECKNSIDELQEKLDAAPPLPALKSVATIQSSIAIAKENNEIAARFKEKAANQAKAATLQLASQTLTDAIAARNKKLAEDIHAADFPVAGMTFTEDALLLNGIPFKQASDAEQLRTSVSIAMSLNPKLKVIRVRDGSLLDEDGLNLLAEMTEAKGYQIWIERVDSSGKVGFVMENGEVKGAEAKAAPAAIVSPAKQQAQKPSDIDKSKLPGEPQARPGRKPAPEDLL